MCYHITFLLQANAFNGLNIANFEITIGIRYTSIVFHNTKIMSKIFDIARFLQKKENKIFVVKINFEYEFFLFLSYAYTIFKKSTIGTKK